MRAHYLQHVPFEGLGSIERWLQKASYEITCTKLYDNEALPPLDGIDLLIVMGGPMSVNDEPKYPWLVSEKAFVRGAIAAGKATLGICLGAQLIASALGSEVKANPVKEIGWLPIEAANIDRPDVFQFPPVVGVFHWHGETFSLPEGATLTASSQGCVNQAFQIGANVIGLQFHLETTSATAQAIVENCRDELVDGPYVQSEERILQVPPERYLAINSLMANILSYLQQ
ncbi:type 1 glutamine amidotransferase [Cerasicoccus arenae]|uniref:Amidotransferase n=1 Tax=Cerasicoccus arenae TaxID=424488 RepID=A0A8J3DIW1_9BACT|nr:type 1 glutamine amidotransferase [Cerasicoccus arenae]MBK1859152.1 type 1 glutamine amidotransferase [Cerasicoccus arenae]GHB98157.1 amidotransferase [Cerasicoccus arenae]